MPAELKLQRNQTAGRKGRPINAALIAAGVLVMACYWPGLSGGFVFDDFANIVDNAALRVTWQTTWSQWLSAMFSSPASEWQRPLSMLSFAVNYLFSGLDPYWIKLTNVGIHIFNTWLVFGLARALLRAASSTAGNSDKANLNDWPGLWIAAAWALNPINVMAVLFAVQRMESLSHTFVFGGLWLYLRGRRRLIESGDGWPSMIIGLVGGTGLGVLAKESAALLPLYAVLVEGCLLHFASHRSPRDQRLFGLFGLVMVLPALAGIAWLLPRILQANAYATRTFSLGERLLTEPGVVLHYLLWTVLPDPRRLSLFHDDYPVSHGLLSPPSTLLTIMVLAGIAVSIPWLLRRRRPLMALGLAWFVSAQLLTATVIPLELMYEHRNYFASLGVCLALADLLLLMPSTSSQRRCGLVAAVLLLGWFSGVTSLRASQWRDPLQFARSEAQKHPRSARATYGLGRQLVILSDYRIDSPYTREAKDALEQAMRAQDSSILPETALVFLAVRSGQPMDPAWWDSLQSKLRHRAAGPQDTSALASLVGCELQGLCQVPQQDMLDSFDAALDNGHPNAEVLNIYGNYALNLLHDPALALRLWQHAAELAPTVTAYQTTMARMLIATGRWPEARPYIARVRQLGRVGQNEALARDLDHLAAQSKAAGTKDTIHQ